jgi:phosphoribosylformylglycinamidine cyclo-ligase
MVAIVAESYAGTVISRLEASGDQARIIGRIVDGPRGCTVAGPRGSWGSQGEWTASHDA